MPVYDYRCNKCGALYDVYHKGQEVVDDVACPSCGSKSYKKLMSVTQVSIGSSSPSGCSEGSCDPIGGGCAGGMCGLN